VLVTRVDAAAAPGLLHALPEADYDEGGRLLWLGPAEVPLVGKGTIAVVSAGTADLPVAREAIGVARRFGMNEVACYDYDKVIAALMKDKMTEEEAVEFFMFNQIGAWMGENTPVFVRLLPTK